MIKYIMATYLPNEEKFKIEEKIKGTFGKNTKEVVIVNLEHMDSEVLSKFIQTAAIDTFVFTPETLNTDQGKKVISKVLKTDIELNRNTNFLNIYDSTNEENIEKSIKLGNLLLNEEYRGKITHLDYRNDERIFSQNLKGMKNDALRSREKILKKDKDILNFTTQVVNNIRIFKDEYTATHIRSVAVIAEEIARSIDLPEEEIDIIKIGALLHDIGKQDIADNVLKKPTRLDEREFMQMKAHVSLGEIELNDYDLGPYERAKTIASEHHERYDGSGYPRGLKGEQIDILSRIVSLADATQAMFGRSYSQSKTKDELISEIKWCSGRQFDPELVDVLCGILENAPESIYVSYDAKGKIYYDVPTVESVINKKQYNEDKEI